MQDFLQFCVLFYQLTIMDVQVACDCKFCSEKGTGCYTCPRCNARYCSVECYKSTAHLSCSELFYRDCFMEGLRTMQPDSSERMRLTEMLRRLELNSDLNVVDDDDDDGADDLAQRFADVNIDSCSTELIWQRLTESERADFEKFMASDRVGGLVELWEPWWCMSSQNLVEEIENAFVSPSSVPHALANVQHIDQLAKSGVSDVIAFSIINVLYAYAYTSRLYNGEHLTMASESAVVMLDISESLSRGIFSDAALAVGGCRSRLDGSVHFISREYSVGVVDDVCKILSGATRDPLLFPLAALSDCHRVFSAACKEASCELRRSCDDEPCAIEDRKRYYAVKKKLEFFISWTCSHGHTLLELLPALELESCELKTQLAVHRSEQKRVEEIIEHKKSDVKVRPLIEELPRD